MAGGSKQWRVEVNNGSVAENLNMRVTLTLEKNSN